MTLNGFVSGFILVLLFVLQIHSKSAPSLRQKRAPGLQHPRLGRRSEPDVRSNGAPIEISTRILQHPRLGGKRSSPFLSEMPIEISARMFQHPRLGGKRSTSVETTTYSLDDLNLDHLDPAIKDKFIELFMNMVAEASNSHQSEGQKNFLAYPRQGRSSQLVDFPRAARAAWHYPRMGRSWSPQNNDASSLSDLCCPKGPKDVMTLELFDEPRAFCRAEKCCKGLTEVTRFSEDRSIVFSLCLPDDIALIQDGTQES